MPCSCPAASPTRRAFFLWQLPAQTPLFTGDLGVRSHYVMADGLHRIE